MEKYIITYLPIAVHDLEDIIIYTKDKLKSPQAAENFIAAFGKSTEHLSNFPYSHSIYTPLKSLKKEHRMAVINNYAYFYTVLEDTKTIEIERVIYAKRDISKLKV